MPVQTVVLKSNPGIKRDGTKYEGDFYVDGQWMRFQRGLPRKMGGYRSINKYLTEISRGFTSYTQQLLQYCHSGGATKLERFTIDETKNSSIISDRTPVATAAYGSITLATGAAGSVDSVTVNGVTITSGSVAFNTSLSQTATDLASNINAYTSSPNYTAVANGATVTITSVTTGSAVNGFVVTASLTTITATYVNMNYGSDGLDTSALNQWMFQYMYDSSGSGNSIIAHVAPNLECVCNDEGGQIFIGDNLGTAPLTEIMMHPSGNATGGVVVLHPYLFYYGTDGVIGHSVAGNPTDLTGSGSGISRPWGQKIIKGMPLRAGSGTAPAGLFWAYDAVIRATFTGGATIFQYDVIATDTSIMSSQCVVDYDGVFFWAGVDRFLMFNGVVRDVPNQMNINYFLDGLNNNHRSKVFAFKVPRYGEIWWCYPRGDATECTHAVIYNVREQTWYDTELPASGRGNGQFNNGFAAPLLTDCIPTASGYRVWIHEQGVDEIDGQNVRPVQSYFETADLSSLPAGKNNYLRITTIEPDFIQSGNMTVQVTGRANARAPEVYSSLFTFPDNPETPHEQIVMLKEQRRELRVKFQSFEVNGDYQMGQIIGHIDTTVVDKTVLG